MSDWPDAVLFDFDGVLVHSEPLHYVAFQTIADRDAKRQMERALKSRR